MLMALRSGLYEGTGPSFLDQVRNEVLKALAARDSIALPEIPSTRPLTRLNLSFVLEELTGLGVVTCEEHARKGYRVVRMTEHGRSLLGQVSPLRRAG